MAGTRKKVVPMSGIDGAARGDASTGAVERALAVLEAVVDLGPSSSLGVIAGRVGLAKPTTHRMLRILGTRGYVRQRDDGTYQPSLRVLQLAGRIWSTLSVAEHARDTMLWLQGIYPETIHLAWLEGTHAYYIEKLETRRAYRMASAVGMPLDLHSTAIGKAILAFVPDAERPFWLDERPLSARTPNTLTNRVALENELAVVLSCGFAIDDEENEKDIRCVGAAIFDNRLRPAGGISISATSFHLTHSDALSLGPHVVLAASRISISLGAPSDRLPLQYIRHSLELDRDAIVGR